MRNREFALRSCTAGAISVHSARLPHSELAFGRLRLGHAVSDTVAKEVVQLVDKGALDEAIAKNAPPLDATAERRRYADSREFSHEDWKRRHGATD